MGGVRQRHWGGEVGSREMGGAVGRLGRWVAELGIKAVGAQRWGTEMGCKGGVREWGCRGVVRDVAQRWGAEVGYIKVGF